MKNLLIDSKQTTSTKIVEIPQLSIDTHSAKAALHKELSSTLLTLLQASDKPKAQAVPSNQPNLGASEGQKSPFGPGASSGESNAGIRGKFNLWWNYLESYGNNIAALIGFMDWIINEAHVNGNKATVKDILKRLGVTTGPTGSLAEALIPILMGMMYANGDSEAQIRAALEALMGKLNGAGNSDFINQLKQNLQFYLSGSNLDDWYTQTKENYTPSQFEWKVEEEMLDFFFGNSSVKRTGHDIFMDGIDRLIEEFKKNPAELIALIFATLGLSMNENIQSMGADGNLNKELKKLNEELANIESQFSKAEGEKGFTGAELKKMFTEITNLMFQVDCLKKMLGSSIADQTNDAFSKLFGTKIKYEGKEITFKQLLQMKNINWNEVAGACSSGHIFWNPGTPRSGNKPGTPAGPSDLTRSIISSLQTTGNAYNSKQQTISTEMSQLSQQVQTLEGLIKQVVCTDYSQNWIGQLVRNQIPR